MSLSGEGPSGMSKGGGFTFSPSRILGGVGGALSNYAGRRASVKNIKARQADDFRYDVLRQMQFKPMAPYATLGKGRLLAGIAKAWGMEDMIGGDLLSYISDPMNIPGVQGFGKTGPVNLQGPEATGIKAPEYSSGGALGVFGDILKGVSGAFGG